MATLYELTGDYLQLVKDDELDADMIADTLEGLDGLIEEKAENIAKVAAQIEGDVTIVDQEIARLTKRKKSMQARRSSVLDYLKGSMQALGKKKIESELFTISLAKGRESVEVFDENALPSQLTRTSVSPDKTKIKAALADGDVPGARLVRGDDSLRIK